MIKLGSLFDGIGGWQLAAVKCGITPIWSSEIEKFPQEVTARHFPKTKQLGDITKINGAEIEPVDIICMGSPCQDLSVAGKREGLDGERSGLFKTAINIIRDMRRATKGKYPRFVVWENVPGAFSSNGGHDFRTVLEEITESKIPMPASGKWARAGMVRSNKCEVAWRVLDAQHWGVPQRRKRIFLVADFRGQRSGEILFKPESVSGDFTPGESERQGTTGNVAFGVNGASRIGHCLRAAASKADKTESTTYIINSSLGFDTKDSIKNSIPVLTDKTPPIKTNNRLGIPAITAPAIYDMTHANHVISQIKGGVVQTLTARMGTGGGNQVPIMLRPIPINDKATRYKGGGDTRQNDGAGNGLGIGKAGDPAPTLTAGDRHAVGYTATGYAKYIEGVGTLKASGGDIGGGSETLLTDSKVRRLTPTECERLQGLPDGYTESGSDSARYKAIGNGMAQPCADYVIQNIAKILEVD